MEQRAVVTNDEWVTARKELLAAEKEFTRARDRLSERRRALPWEPVEKEYVFDGESGTKTLSDLFDGRSQLIVYHFMFDPEWDAGCKSCSFWADNFDRIIVHLHARDVTMVAVSRAPLDKLLAYRARMGWSFDWLSSFRNDFNFDYGVSFTPEELERGEALYNYGSRPNIAEREGLSVFSKDAEGRVFHTYSAYARGIDMVNTAYHYLDLVPQGRGEEPDGNPQSWVRRRDEYGDAP
jgi:predicted dithiol-disulfide oxidoreductase (DUF899 family)